MNDRDERLRELLRAADPAPGAPELGEGEVAWMRQRVLRAASEAPAHKPVARAWVVAAGAAALLALALGLALMRTVETPATSTPQHAAPLRADASPQLRVPPGSAREAEAAAASPHAENAGASAAAQPQHAEIGGASAAAPPRAAEPAGDSAVQLASRAADYNGEGARPGAPMHARRPRPRADAAASAPRATIAQAPAERQPYQLQLTAPGGTRIVWLLTADNGR